MTAGSVLSQVARVSVTKTALVQQNPGGPASIQLESRGPTRLAWGCCEGTEGQHGEVRGDFQNRPAVPYQCLPLVLIITQVAAREDEPFVRTAHSVSRPPGQAHDQGRGFEVDLGTQDPAVPDACGQWGVWNVHWTLGLGQCGVALETMDMSLPRK